MPTYNYKCPNPNCGHKQEAIRPIEQRRTHPPICAVCNTRMVFTFSAPALLNTNGGPTGGVKKDGSGGADQLTADVMGIPVKELPATMRHNR